MIMRLLMLTLCWVSLSAKVPEHAIYISVIELEKEANSQTSTLSVKVFSDDLIDVIRNYSKSYLPKGELEFVKANVQSITDYFNANLRIRINEEPMRFQFEKSELEGDAYFIYFAFKSVDSWKKLDLKAPYFTELFPDQSNILKVKQAGKTHHGRLTKSNPAISIIFD